MPFLRAEALRKRGRTSGGGSRVRRSISRRMCTCHAPTLSSTRVLAYTPCLTVSTGAEAPADIHIQAATSLQHSGGQKLCLCVELGISPRLVSQCARAHSRPHCSVHDRHHRLCDHFCGTRMLTWVSARAQTASCSLGLPPLIWGLASGSPWFE